ncbi:YceD family protein [Peptococcus simiae]
MLSLNLAPIRPQVKSDVPFSFETGDLPLMPTSFRITEPIKAEGIFRVSQFDMQMLGRVTGQIQVPCDRCLKPVTFDVDLDIDEKLVYSLDVPNVKKPGEDIGDLEERYWIYDKTDYDFEPLIVDAILQSLPVTIVCQEDCKGLCPKCGQNLNLASCQCETIEIDPRWAKLAQLRDGEVE